jgi:hypothetical protein
MLAALTARLRFDVGVAKNGLLSPQQQGIQKLFYYSSL